MAYTGPAHIPGSIWIHRSSYRNPIAGVGQRIWYGPCKTRVNPKGNFSFYKALYIILVVGIHGYWGQKGSLDHIISWIGHRPQISACIAHNLSFTKLHLQDMDLTLVWGHQEIETLYWLLHLDLQGASDRTVGWPGKINVFSFMNHLFVHFWKKWFFLSSFLFLIFL